MSASGKIVDERTVYPDRFYLETPYEITLRQGLYFVKVAQGEFDQGVLMCGTGSGMSMAANKVHGIRAAVCHNTFSARRAREHNDANVLCMGGWVVGEGIAREVIAAYLASEFVGGRHARRLEKMHSREQLGK